jgi:hypothetical protein
MYYATLADAITAVGNPTEEAGRKTITLVDDVEISTQVNLPAYVTLYGGGHTIKATGSSWPTGNGSKFMLLATTGDEIKNLTVDGNNVTGTYGVQFYCAAKGKISDLTIQNVKKCGLIINASDVTATGTVTLSGNGWNDSINVGWGENITTRKTCTFDFADATVTANKIYRDDDDLTHANGVTGAGFYFYPSSGWAYVTYADGSLGYVPESTAEAQIGSIKYGNLETALSVAEAGDTITLLKNVTVEAAQAITKNQTINLSGYTITGDDTRVFQVKGGTLNLTGTGIVTTTLKTTTKEAKETAGTLGNFRDSSVIRVGDNDVPDGTEAKLIVGASVTINAPETYGVSVFGAHTKETVTINGTINAVYRSALSGNGDASLKKYDTTITINDGAKLTSTQYPAIYHPQNGTLYVLGGTIQGAGGIEAKSGTVSISGNPTITATAAISHVANDNDPSTRGYAVAAVESNPYPGKATVTISGGYISGGVAVIDDHNNANDDHKGSISVTGGFFSSNPSALVTATGKTGVLNTSSSTSAKYPFTVGERNEEAAATKEAETTVSAKEGINTTAPDALGTKVNTALTGVTKPSVSGGGLQAAVAEKAEDVKTTAEDALEALKTSENVNTDGKTAEDVNFVVQYYMDVKITNVTDTTTKNVTLDITPKAQTIATTVDDVSQINTTVGAGQNAVVVEEETLEITRPVTVTIPLAGTDLVTASSNATIKHTKKNAQNQVIATYYYKGTVDASSVLTFDNPHGFSEFEMGTDVETEANTAVVAWIGTVGYTSLQDAVDEVIDGGTIELTAAYTSAEAATVGRAVSFNVTGTGAATANITKTGNYSLTKGDGVENGSTLYTATYVAPSYSGVSTYAVNIASTTGGKVTASTGKTAKGTEVTLTVAADTGKALDTLTVTDASGNKITVNKNASGTYYFTMPASEVTVKATFKDADQAQEPEEPEEPAQTASFTDVDASKWYNAAVEYVVSKGIMEGYGNNKFGPNDNLTRAQLAQILYNAAGAPEVTGESPFTDVTAGKWYTKAVTWAYEAGVVEGYGNGKFGPNDKITREQLATMIWRYAGEVKATTDSLSSFTDAAKVSSYAQDALLWATEKSIVQGDKNVIDPKGNATRAQAATMIMRYLELG